MTKKFVLELNYYDFQSRDYKVGQRDYKVGQRDYKVGQRDYKVGQRDYKVGQRDYKVGQGLQSGAVQIRQLGSQSVEFKIEEKD